MSEKMHATAMMMPSGKTYLRFQFFDHRYPLVSPNARSHTFEGPQRTDDSLFDCNQNGAVLKIEQIECCSIFTNTKEKE